MRKLAVIAALSAGAVACGAPTVDRPDGSVLNNNNNNNMNQMPPPIPVVQAPPARIPYPIATVRGSAMGRRVFVRVSGGNPIAEEVLPDGSFCVDVPLETDGNYTLSVSTQNEVGLLSEEVEVMVERSANAAPVPGALTCGGFQPGDCESAIEICGDNRDNDCNNLVDEQDPACRTCEDDDFEPNDGFDAARVVVPQLQELTICPGDTDVFGVYVEESQEIRVQLRFTHTEGDLELEFYNSTTDPEMLPTLLRSSLTTDDDEEIVYTATVAGVYKVRVFGVDSNTANRYSLAFVVADD